VGGTVSPKWGYASILRHIRVILFLYVAWHLNPPKNFPFLIKQGDSHLEYGRVDGELVEE